ncbi:MAG: ATP-grasp domain-containing protein [Anaerovoracaceae bacterium]|jgi:D-aspartate ligase
MKKSFTPLLFAGDINVCSVARAFHEQYGITSTAYGKYPTGPCMNSKIIDYHAVEQADEKDTFLRLVREFAAAHSDQTVFLIGCGDSYVELVSACKAELPDNVIAPCIDVDLMHDLINKEKFYQLCEETGIDYPDTFVHRREMGLEFELPFGGPFIVKPADSIEYWRHPFASQQKVYRLDTFDDVRGVLSDIYDAGYDGSIIIQNFIPGGDTYMRVLTNYSDRHGKVKMQCLGHVLLEEHTPHGSGNHAVIITEHNTELEEKIRRLLDSLHYVGYSNLDIKYDRRDGKYKVFEINTRQGRSNYYVTGSGGNIARYLVEDYIENKPLEFEYVDEENLWLVVPKKVAFTYVRSDEYRHRMQILFDTGKYVNPLLYKPDNGLMRRLRIWHNIHRHYKAFKTWMPPEE